MGLKNTSPCKVLAGLFLATFSFAAIAAPNDDWTSSLQEDIEQIEQSFCG